eukprot:8099924-Pyramimonas_sp.AAC.2
MGHLQGVLYSTQGAQKSKTLVTNRVWRGSEGGLEGIWRGSVRSPYARNRQRRGGSTMCKAIRLWCREFNS